jgi:predicted NUDIX family phosphoesterase
LAINGLDFSVHDDSNEVGKVHLGVVHIMELESADVSRKEQMITQLNFMNLNELNKVKDSMETWSSLCLDLLAKIEEQD